MNLTVQSLRKTILLLLSFFLLQAVYPQEIIEGSIKNAQHLFARLDAQDTYKDNLNHVDMNMLPSGFKQSINNMEVTVAINGAEFYPEYTVLSAFLRIILPAQNNKTLFFAAKDIKLSHDGDIIGEAKLNLLSDIEIPISDGNIILRLKGDFNKTTGISRDLTYVSIDCKGVKGLGISAEVELSPNLCYPAETDGEDTGKKVIGYFQTEIENWNDIVAKISFPPFCLKGLKDFVWTVEDAVFDFSDLKNAQGFTFPEGYDRYLIPGNDALWQGVYIRNLAVQLPPQFSKGEDKRVSFSAHDMIIDDNGVSGLFGAHNILSIKEGNASGWAFSVDYFGLKLMANTLEGAEFNGMIGLPISEKSNLLYKGLITADDKYLLQVASMDTLSFDMLQAKVELDPNSYVEFKVDKGKFRPEAMLHGRMGFDISLEDGGKTITQFKGVEFRSMHLKTENPYLSVEYMGYNGEIKLMNFPVSIKDISLTAQGDRAALGFDVDLTLGDRLFAGNTRLEIHGTMEGGKLHKWKYDKTKINKINIDATIAGGIFHLKGGLTILNNHAVYGDGFDGELEIGFKDGGPLGALNIRARAMFGRTDFRYWFVDGIATIPGIGLPIGQGIHLTGFGGGISHKMKPAGLSSGGSMSATSMTYVPNEKSSLGIKASVAFAVPVKETVSGEATFELSFNNKGGLDYAGFYGYAQIMAVIPGVEDFQKKVGEKYAATLQREQQYTKGNNALEDNLRKYKQYDPNEASKMMISEEQVNNLGKSQFAAAVGIQFNFAESSFHATFDLYANVLGGMIRGVGKNNRAGYAVLHVDPQDWYMYIGTPTDRVGLRMGISSIYTVETSAYLMLGTKIPAAAGVPKQVASALGYDPQDLDYMKDLNTIGDGRGFAFGANMSVNTGDLTFLILYANYSAGMGFDIMLKDYGDTQCKGRSGAIGMNGWYANGQAYGYLHGELGVKVNLWFLKAKLPIFTADMGALLQAKLPNPSSFKAYMAVRAKLLGGLVKVNCRFKLMIGEDCELVIPGGSPLDMMMISDLSPIDRSNDISVFTAPQARFNLSVDKAFDIQDDDGEKTYRIKLKDFVLNDGQNVIGGLKWNVDKDAVSFYSHEILSPEKEITATVRVVFEELKNGRWHSVYTAGKEAIESKTIAFSTGNAPKDIPLQNIVYAYPVVDQQYYMKGESNKGYIQLQHGQSYLFPTDLKNQIVLQDENGNKQYADFRYNEAVKRIDYNMLQSQNSHKYELKVASLSKGDTNASNIVAINDQSLLNDEEDGTIDIENRQATAETRTDIGAVLLSYQFRSSRYNTFKEKVDDIRKTTATAGVITSDVLMFGYETDGMEPFDMAELKGTEQTESKALVDVSATLEDYYYKQKIYPLIYKDYPIGGTIRVKRENVAEIGLPPTKALPVRTDYLTRIEQGEYNGLVTRRFPYYYNLPSVYKTDFIDLQHQVINSTLGSGSGNQSYSRFVQATFPFISSENYRIRLQYFMPGGVKGTSSTFDYYNFVK